MRKKKHLGGQDRDKSENVIRIFKLKPSQKFFLLMSLMNIVSPPVMP